MKLSKDILQSLLQNAHLDHKGENLYSKCPWCNGNEFGISLADNHLFRCFRGKKCGETGNIYKLLKRLDRMDLIEDRSITVNQNKLLENKLKILANPELSLSLPKKIPPLGFKRLFKDDYLDSRGFGEREYQTYRYGKAGLISDLKNYIIILCEEEGECKGYIARHLWKKEQLDAYNKVAKLEGRKEIPRYNNSKDDFSKMLFGIDEVIEGKTKTVLLVEGLFGKTNVTTQLDLWNVDEIKCLATYGSKISKYQIEKLLRKGVENVILLYDFDAIAQIKKYSAELKHVFNTTVGVLWDERDPGDLNAEEIMQVLENTVDPFTFNFNKVTRKYII